MIRTAVTSTVDGSVVIAVDMNVSDAEKELAKLKKSITKLEKDVIDATAKRDKAQKESLFKAGVLDEEKAKLQEIKDRLSDLQAMSKDKGIDLGTREKYKAMIPDVRQELADQKTRVSALQTEWNKQEASVERYNNKINDSTAQLTQQKERAGELRQKIDEANAAVSGMAVADQRIVDLNRELLELKKRQEELAGLGVGLGYEEYDQNAARIAGITRELKEYEKALKGVHASEAQSGQEGPGSVPGKADAQARLNAYLEKSSSLYQKLSAAIGKTSEMSSVLQDLSELTSGRLSAAFQTAGSALGGFSTRLSGALAAAGPYVTAAAAAATLLRKIISSMTDFGQQAAESIIRGTKAVADFAVSTAKSFVLLLKSIGKFSSSAVKAVSEVSKKVIDLSENFNVFPTLTDSLAKKFRRLGQMIRRVFVFSVITSGLRAIRTQVSLYLKANTELTTALRRLQGAFLTAFQPVYETVVPALTTLINVLTRAVATVTQFFASLFGTTAKQAQTNAKDLYEQANATTAAGDAAEEAAKQLASFDEINKLEGENESGGGAASVDTGPLFDYEYDETPFDSWGEAFSAFLDKLLEGIPKLKEAFKNFADWLNERNRKLYEMFTFPGVLDKVKQLGRELAEALDELVNEIDWGLWGRALGAGLNLALNFLTSFLYAFDWINLGRKLAEFVNGLVAEIDWYEFGRLLWAGYKIGLETFAGFITGLDMPQLAQAASQTMIGFFTEMKNTIERIPWGEIGAQIATFLSKINWYGIITVIADAIKAALEAAVNLISEFIRTMEWGKIAEQIYTAINDELGNEELFTRLGKTLSGLFIHIFDFLREVIAGIEWGQLGADIAAFILGFDWAGALGSLADLIAEGINAAVRLLRGLLDKIMPEIRGVAEGIAERLNEAVKNVQWAELGRVISDAIETAIDFLIAFIDQIEWKEVGDAIRTCLENIDWKSLFSKVGTLIGEAVFAVLELVFGDPGKGLKIGADIVGGILLGILNAISGIHKWIKENFVDPIVNAVKDHLRIHSPSLVFAEIGENLIAGLLQGISDAWNSIVEFFSNAVDNLKQFFSNAWEAIKTAASTAWESIKNTLSQTWSNLKEQASTIFNAIKETIGQVWDGIKQKATDVWNSIKETIGQVWENIKQKSSEIWNNIKTTLSQTWENIKTTAQQKFESIKQKISEIWSNIKQTTASTWEGIKSDLSAKWESIKSTAATAFNAIKEKITTAWNNIKSETSSKWNEIKSALASAWDNIKSSAQEKFNSIKQSIIDKMNELKNHDWKSIGSSIMNGIWNGLKSVWESLTSWLSSAANSIMNAFSGITSSMRSGSFGSSYSGSFGGNYRMSAYALPDISDYNIPALARGAVIPPNREFLAVLGDQRSGTNIEAPLSTIEQAVENVMSRMGSAGKDIVVNLTVELDGTVITRKVIRIANDMTMQSGQPVFRF